MFLMITVASLCGVVLLGGLMRLACRHRPDWWFTSDDAILCLVSPVIILLITFGGVSLGYRMTHGGFKAIPLEGWIGAVVILAIGTGTWVLLARWIRRGERAPTAGAAIH